MPSLTYPPRTRLESARYWRDQQVKFMVERGTTAAGYQAFYAEYGVPEERVQAIYEADVIALHQLAAEVALREVGKRPRT